MPYFLGITIADGLDKRNKPGELVAQFLMNRPNNQLQGDAPPSLETIEAMLMSRPNNQLQGGYSLNLETIEKMLEQDMKNANDVKALEDAKAHLLQMKEGLDNGSIQRQTVVLSPPPRPFEFK